MIQHTLKEQARNEAARAAQKLAAVSHLLTNEEIEFICFLAAGFHEPASNTIQLSTGKSSSANPRFFDFVAFCTADDKFTTITKPIIWRYIYRVIASANIFEPNTKIGPKEFLELCEQAKTIGSPAFMLLTGAIQPILIFREQELANTLGAINYIAHLLNETTKRPTDAATSHEKHLPILAQEYPEFGIAFKAKIKDFMLALPQYREAFSTWQQKQLEKKAG